MKKAITFRGCISISEKKTKDLRFCDGCIYREVCKENVSGVIDRGALERELKK